jgi:signal peptidase I
MFVCFNRGRNALINDYPLYTEDGYSGMSNTLAKIRHNDYIKSAIVIIVIVGVVLGAFVGLGVALNTSVPVRVVESGSMSIPLNYITGPPRPYTLDDFISTLQHPFSHTLDTGDIIIIQGVKAEDLNTNYPNSDIIVYKNPDSPNKTPIVHRIVAVNEINGTLYFQTKGDGNGQKWPEVPPISQYDSNSIYSGGQGVPEELIEGRVVLRIPWFGWITLFMRDNAWGLPLIVGLILLLVFVEFLYPVIKEGIKKEQAQQANTESPSESPPQSLPQNTDAETGENKEANSETFPP